MALKKVEDVPEREPENFEEYEARVKAGDPDPLPYDRLMIRYRKEKKYKEEMAVIKKAISVFEKIHAGHQSALLKKKGAKGPNLQSLSKKIALQTGLVDKKGKALFVPEPMARWKKRLDVVGKKLAK